MKRTKILNIIDKAGAIIIAFLGLKFAQIGANAGCCFILHQPEKPDMNKLRKYN